MKRFLWLILAIFVVITSIAIYFILTAPPREMSEADKEAKLTEILGRKPNLSDTTPTGNIKYQGKYASFTYPAAAKIYTYRDAALKQDSSILETFSFDITNPRLVVNFAVTDRSNLSSVDEIPDVRFRQQSSSGYIQVDIEADGVKGLSFEKKGQESEKSAFFLKGKVEFSVSITGNNYKEVEKLFNQVVSSLKFNP